MNKFLAWLCPHKPEKDTGAQEALDQATARLAAEAVQTARAEKIAEQLRISRERDRYAQAIRHAYGGLPHA